MREMVSPPIAQRESRLRAVVPSRCWRKSSIDVFSVPVLGSFMYVHP